MYACTFKGHSGRQCVEASLLVAELGEGSWRDIVSARTTTVLIAATSVSHTFSLYRPATAATATRYAQYATSHPSSGTSSWPRLVMEPACSTARAVTKVSEWLSALVRRQRVKGKPLKSVRDLNYRYNRDYEFVCCRGLVEDGIPPFLSSVSVSRVLGHMTVNPDDETRFTSGQARRGRTNDC